MNQATVVAHDHLENLHRVHRTGVRALSLRSGEAQARPDATLDGDGIAERPLLPTLRWNNAETTLPKQGLSDSTINRAYHRARVRAADNPLQGAWQVTNANGFAGIFIFSAKHYSMMAASTERPEITDLSKARADEVRALYGPMIGNAGGYEMSGNQVTIRPVVAKIPVVMKLGAYGTGPIDRCRSRHQKRGARSHRPRHSTTLAFCAVIVWAVSFTSTSWPRDQVFGPYSLVAGWIRFSDSTGRLQRAMRAGSTASRPVCP